jgi:prepilin signal peptidase PulO-like enzyme (type II secretory pathway)
MKTTISTKDVVYICLFAALSVVSIFALVFSMSDVDTKFLQFDARGVHELLGVLVSTMSLVVTVIFVVLAISAYGNISKIKKTKKKVYRISGQCSDELTRIKQKKEEYQQENEEMLFRFNDEQIQMAEVHKYRVFRNELKVRRARMARYSMLDPELRIVLLNDLANIGDKGDVRLIEQIIAEVGRDDVKKAAEQALEVLEARLSMIRKILNKD